MLLRLFFLFLCGDKEFIIPFTLWSAIVNFFNFFWELNFVNPTIVFRGLFVKIID